MKTNKLAIVLVLLLVIVIIGWVSYSKKNSIENGSMTEEQKNQAALNDTSGSNGNNIDCTSPTITVLSPNGGESYKSTSSVTFKWRTCGIATTAHITGAISGVSNPKDGTVLFGEADDQKIFRDKKSLNDGQITIDLSKLPVKAGTYKFKISVIDLPGINDMSEKEFTITK